MDFLQFLNEVKMSSDEKVQSMAEAYDIHFSIREIQLLRPLLDEISFHWLLTGIPTHFIQKVERIVGTARTESFLQLYHHTIQNK